MAKAKKHTDNIYTVTLGNNSAFVKWFSIDYPISLVRIYVRQS